MRALVIVAALFCAMATDVAAQAGREAARPDQGEALAAPSAQSLQNACVSTEVVSAPQSFFPPTVGQYYHSFYINNPGDNDTYRIDVTPGGLRLNSASQVAPSAGSPEADTRFNTLIETLRAAAASRSRFRIDARSARVTQVIVAWSQRCS
jgi:hypothetical protein